jgi:excisionase family DNA binding protein
VRLWVSQGRLPASRAGRRKWLVRRSELERMLAAEDSRRAKSVDRLLTAQEVADRLGVNTQWVWAQARAGRMPHVRLGRYRRFRESAVEAWVCELEASSTSRTPSVSLRPSA